MQLPAIPPTVPATLGPTRLCINRSMGDFAFFFGFFVPDAATRIEFGTIESCRLSAVSPGFEYAHQMPTEIPNQLWQGRWQLRQPAFPGAAGGKLAGLMKPRFEVVGD